MKYEDLERLSPDLLLHDLIKFSEHDGICALKGMIPIPVDEVSFSYKNDEDIIIHDEMGNCLGFLCICKSTVDIEPESLTDARYIAFINEVDSSKFKLKLPFKFTRNYLVIYVYEYENYKNKYMDSAPIWGGFIHSRDGLQEAYKSEAECLRLRLSLIN